MSEILLCDASNFLHRSLHAMNNPEVQLKTTDGKITTGISLFLNMINSEIKKRNYDCQVFLLWDSGIPIFRRKIFSNYKYWKEFVPTDGIQFEDYLLSDYNKMSDDEKEKTLHSDVTFLENYTFSRKALHEELLPALGLRSIKIPNTEADDLIAYISYLLVKNNYGDKITIISSDGDYKQLLLEDKIEIYNPIKKLKFTEDEFYISMNDLDITKQNWRKFWLTDKAINGDPSDNVPGFEGIGGTSAYKYAKLIVCGGIKQSDLPKVPRSKEDSYKYFISDQGVQDFERNLKLIDMCYFIDNEPEYCKYLRDGLRSSQYITPNAEIGYDYLRKYQLTKFSLIVDDLCESVISHNDNTLYDIINKIDN